MILREAAQHSPATAVQPVSPAPAAPARSQDDTATRLPRVTLIIGGGIAAYKALDLIRRLKERRIARPLRADPRRAAVRHAAFRQRAVERARLYRPVRSRRASSTPAISVSRRECDLIVVAPATADLMAKMAQGHADDLASAILLAANRPILLAPAMNPLMWNNAATRRNVAQLQRDGIAMVGPNAGEMAEANEAGVGRMAEPLEIAAAAEQFLRPPQPRPLAGKRVLITAGPTHEPIDPVRYIANRSSGKQGFAIAAAAAAAGAEVTLVSGPVDLADPAGRHRAARGVRARHAAAVEASLPVDIAIFAAAVADWRVANEGGQKLKKTAGRHAAAAAGRKSRHSRDDLKAGGPASAAGDRLRRRDRAPDRQRQSQTRAQGLRLDRRQ